MSNSVMKNQGNLDEEYLAEKSRDFEIFKKYYEVFYENSPQIKSDEESLKKNFTSHKSKYGDGRDILKFHDFLKGNGDENSSKDPFFLAFREYCLFSQFRSNYNKTSKYSDSPIIPESKLLLTFDSFRRGEYNIYYNNSPQKYNKNDVDRFLSDTLLQKEEKNFANPVFLAYNIIVSRYCPEELKELKEAEARAKEEAEANANKTNFFDVSNFIGAIVQSGAGKWVAGNLGFAEKEAADLAASRDCPPSINPPRPLESRKQSQVETTREAKVRARENVVRVNKDLARIEKEVGEAVQRANDAEQKAKDAAYKARQMARQIAQQIVNQNPEMRYANGDCPPSRLGAHIKKSQGETLGDFEIFKKYYEVFYENSPQIKSDEESLKKNFTSHKSKYGDGRDILKFHDFLKGNGDENSSKDPFFLAFREYCLFSQFRSNYNKTSKYSDSPIIPESKLLLTFDSFRRGEYNIYYNNSPQKYNKNDVDRFLSDTLSQKEEKNFANPVFLAYNIIVSRYCPEELKELKEAKARARENVVRVNKDLARGEKEVGEAVQRANDAEQKAKYAAYKARQIAQQIVNQNPEMRYANGDCPPSINLSGRLEHINKSQVETTREAEARAKEEAEANANKTNFFDVSNFIGAIVQSGAGKWVAGHLGVAENEAADLAASRDCPPSINPPRPLESRKQSQGKENSKESEPNSQNFQYHAPKFQDVWVRLFKFISRANGLDKTPTSNQLPKINKEPYNPIVPRVINNNKTTPATKKKMLPAITTTPKGWVHFTNKNVKEAPNTKRRRRFWDDPQPHQQKHPRQI